MPTVLRAGGYQFVIFTSDHPPAHVHVRREGRLAKLRLEPLEFERTGGFNSSEQSNIIKIARENYASLLAKWDSLFPAGRTADNDQ